jgi:hypothetical protein
LERVFGLLDFAGQQNNPVKNMKVEAKGLLIRKRGDDRLNPSSRQTPGDGEEAYRLVIRTTEAQRQCRKEVR